MKKVSAILLIILCFFFFGCNDSKKSKDVEKTEEIVLPEITILGLENNLTRIYEYNSQNLTPTKISFQDEIIDFTKQNNTILFKQITKDKNIQYYLISKNKKVFIKNSNTINALKLSKDGKKVIYNEENNDNIQYYIFDILQESKNELRKDIIISGDMYQWLDDEKIIFYGVDNSQASGIFIYDIINDKLIRLYTVQGYLEFFSLVSDNKLLVLKNDLNNNKQLILYDLENNSKKELTNRVERVDSAVSFGGTIYIEGNVKNNKYSIYEITEAGKINRLIYDFPKILSEKQKIVCDKDGNLIFIGYQEDYQKQEVYVYNVKERYVKVISSRQIEYRVH
ncbi:hypothetical protein CPJCM30710_06330 [Clostridium polyendosporum]|uniref:Lipoprotein n=1 Tax=Clostridium polyendosporum TaxID=69208 RepID=A0A919RX95_9CLOT|nr:hypothetical protein [Clostridium polyendosporum]GIM27967.1 hypothetical protein CPJCM30710_06330 [Clostridium polyendosporum]